MIEIKFTLISEVQKFADICRSHEGDILLRHNSYVVDATSLLGIMSLNLSEPVYIDVIEKVDNERQILFNELKEAGFAVKMTEG